MSVCILLKLETCFMIFCEKNDKNKRIEMNKTLTVTKPSPWVHNSWLNTYIILINHLNMRQRITISYFLHKHWLLVAILLCIFLAGIYPKLGSKEGI